MNPADLKLSERKSLLACATGEVAEVHGQPGRIVRRTPMVRLSTQGGPAGVFPEQHGPAVRSLVAKGLVARRDDGSYTPTEDGDKVLDALRRAAAS